MKKLRLPMSSRMISCGNGNGMAFFILLKYCELMQK